jgi:hypothetical protein
LRDVAVNKLVIDEARGWKTRVKIPAGLYFSLRHNVQTGSAAHPASYSMSIEFFPWG